MLSFFLLLTFIGIYGSPSERLGVVGGRNATEGELPYITSYEEYVGEDRNPICGASIITKSWVITAAHCIGGTPIEKTWIHAGMIDVNDPQAQRRQVVKTIRHDNFVQFGGDIALIKVDPPFEFNDLVQPIKVPKQDAELSSNTAILSGWGLHSFPMSDWSSILQTVELPIIPYEECMQILEEQHESDANKYNNTVVCTGPVTGGKGACYGDSGGPLVQDGVLIGAVSWGTQPCANDGSVTIYTKVSSYIDWINENIDEPIIFV
ncbi:chymotrypsin-1-like [Diabrotica undecimpunctata]|uniref:chymotrypsin-1-like n=1 Tax=Diabrotica undecimpunctata TaxID=50387 RepID=UPI003B63B95D